MRRYRLGDRRRRRRHFGGFRGRRIMPDRLYNVSSERRSHGIPRADSTRLLSMAARLSFAVLSTAAEKWWWWRSWRKLRSSRIISLHSACLKQFHALPNECFRKPARAIEGKPHVLNDEQVAFTLHFDNSIQSGPLSSSCRYCIRQERPLNLHLDAGVIRAGFHRYQTVFAM